MFEQHFGLRENPFHSGHQMRFLYPSREHQEARAHLRYGIENREPFVLITGEVGTGKTTALYDALAEWGSQVTVALVTNSSLDRLELIHEICIRFGLVLAPASGKPQAIAQLEKHLLGIRARGEHAVLLLDEAQNLAAELLEEIRLLSNLEAEGEKLLQIFLVGQPELEAKLAEHALRQLRQRITVHYRLNPLSPEETVGYIHHRIAVAGGNPVATFPPEACLAIYHMTHGIPREINTVAGQSMIAAYTDGAATVKLEHVRTVAQEAAFRSVLGQPNVDVLDMEIGGEPEPEAIAPEAPPAPPVAAAPPAPAPAPVAPAPVEDDAPVWKAPSWLPPVLEPVAEAAPAVAAALPLAPPIVTPDTLVPAHEPGDAPHVETVAREELDAWTVAARELMSARQRGPAADAADSYTPSTIARATLREDEDEPGPNAFPTREELVARAPTADPTNADLSGLPERLRRKIEADIAREERPNRSLPAVLASVAVVAAVVGTLMLQRFQVIDLPFLRGVVPHAAVPAAQHAAVPAPTPAPVPASTPIDSSASLAGPAVPESAATTHAAPDARIASVSPAVPTGSAPSKPATSAPAVARPTATSTGAAATTAPVSASKPPTTQVAAATPTPPPATQVAAAKPVPAPAKPQAVASTPASGATSPATSSTAAAPVAAPKPPGTFGVGVGSYLDKDRATQERDRLSGLAKLPAVVVPYTDHGTTMYRVILGAYATNAAAERAAGTFMEKYGVSEGLPLKLPKAN